jgi:SynChlorMet cassette protein ScmC
MDLGGLPLHAALVERNGMGILLAGHGGAGKSTCCQRLPSSWHALCDDETLVVINEEKQYFAHPFPTWSDYLWKRSERTWNVQKYVPLSAIFLLEQSETDEAIRIGQGQGATFINTLATDVCRRNWRNLDRKEERAQRKQLFQNACELARAVPAFKLRFSLNGRFWEKIEEVLR